MAYTPKAENKFSFGLWTVGNIGRDPFGDPVRELFVRPVQLVELLGEVGAWGVNFHDNDLVPIDATAAERGPDRERLQEGAGRERPRRADGDDESVYAPGISGRGVHEHRPGGAGVCAAEDDGRDRSGR